MLAQNPTFAQDVLLRQANAIKEQIMTAFLDECIHDCLSCGTRYNGSDQVVGYLSFKPECGCGGQSLDLLMRIDCTPDGAFFTSEIAWSDGKTIDEVMVCNVCPDCLEELCAEVEAILVQKRTILVERLIQILGNFTPV
ncbi:MAG: hypothetical protein JW862_17305 [Anaerolineales bacterium]|nr:hypothetical protein [Anaerolineales bacterium]